MGTVKKSRTTDVSRRAFLQRGGGIVAGAGLGLTMTGSADAATDETEKPGKIPTTTLGRTGIKISILGLGTADLGEQNRKKPSVPKLVTVFSDAIDRGITYVDTARIYGRAEEALATVLAKRRDKVVLATKVWASTYDEAKASFEKSLETMKVDHVDVLHIHSLGDKDVDAILGKDGALKYLEEQKKNGRIRAIGITGHSRPANFVRLLETGKVDVMMVAMNFVDRHIYGFEEKVLPVARKHKTGVLAMKVFGGIQGGFRNYGAKKAHPSQMPSEHHLESIRYARTLEGVSGMVIGVHASEQVHQNIAMVLAAKPFSKKELAALCEKGEPLAPKWTARFGPAS